MNGAEPPKGLGQVGYEAYAKNTGGKTFDGRDMPEWVALPERIRAAWEAGCSAAMEPLSAFANRQAAEHLILRSALLACASAMRRGVAIGCVDHLDCTDDYGGFWTTALSMADAALKLVDE